MKVKYIQFRDFTIIWYQILMPLFLLGLFITNLAVIGSKYDWKPFSDKEGCSEREDHLNKIYSIVGTEGVYLC